MADNTISIKEDASPTKLLASQSFTRSAQTVHQEEIAIGDGTTNGRICAVTVANALKVDNSAVVQPVSDNGGAITVDALDLDIRNLATGQDKVDVRLRNAADSAFIEPATEKLTAAVPESVRLSDGAAFYDAVKTGQLPAALVGGRLSVDASGVAVPVTDNAGSLTVDAPVGTPLFARLSDGAAALVGQKTMALSLPVALASDQSALPAMAEARAATLHVTATAAVNTASTCTLPAAGAGLFHYITHIELVKLYAVVGTAAAAGVIVTSTNLPGNPSWTTEQAAGPLGTAPKAILYSPATPLKSSVANTATTFVAPLQAQTIWRWNVSYFTGV